MVKPWAQVVTPHSDVLRGQVDETVFAADLDDVVRGRAPGDYRFPEQFFAKTYPTQGLVRLLANVLRRLSGRGGDPVVNLQTPFGGGKTHALIALYHLCQGGEPAAESELVRQAMAEAGVSSLPRAAVACFVGTSPDPLKDRTPWGAIAEQLGRYELVAELDKRRIAPGKELLLQVVGDGPVLILLDELAEYGVRAKDFREQVMAFSQELTRMVGLTQRACLVATLPSSAPYGEEGERVLHQLELIFGSTEVQYELVRGEEIYEVVRRRLFQGLGSEGERERAVAAYWEMYQSLGDDVPGYVREPAYRQRMLRAYPFHPELIDVLYERWSTFSTFQRTRGVLRLLAEMVASLYSAHHSAPLLQPAHLDLANDHIRRELVKHIGNEYNGVIASDISGPNAKAGRLDQEMGAEYSKYRIATGLATAIFFGSFSGGERRGVTLPWLRLASLAPGIPVALVGDAVKRLEDELWYLHAERGLYWFTSQPNINRIRIEREEAVRDDQITEHLKRLVEAAAGNELRTYPWPQAPQDVPDTRDLKLAILGPGHPRPGPAEELAQRLLTQAGTTFRAYANTLVILAPDRGELASLSQKLRRLLALRSIRDDRDLWNRLSDEKRRKVESDLKGLQDGIEFDLRSAYRHLAKASADGVQWEDMGIPTVGERGSLARRVREFLKHADLLAESIGPSQLLDKAFKSDEEELPLSEVRERFLRYPQLPMLASPDVVDRAVQTGVRSGALAVRVNDQVYVGEPPPAWETDSVVVLRPEKVTPTRTEAPREAAAATAGTTATATGGTIEQPATVERRGVARVRLRVELPWDKVSDFYRGVIMPLKGDNADIRLQVYLEAVSPEGNIRQATLDQKVRETLSQLGAQVLEEETS